MPAELMALTILKALVELAGLFLLGQGMLYLLAGEKREANYFYQLLKLLTRPVNRAARLITPRFVIDRHIPYVTGLILFWLWLLVIMLMAQFCRNAGVDCRALKEGSASLEWHTPESAHRAPTA